MRYVLSRPLITNPTIRRRFCGLSLNRDYSQYSSHYHKHAESPQIPPRITNLGFVSIRGILSLIAESDCDFQSYRYSLEVGRIYRVITIRKKEASLQGLSLIDRIAPDLLGYHTSPNLLPNCSTITNRRVCVISTILSLTTESEADLRPYHTCKIPARFPRLITTVKKRGLRRSLLLIQPFATKSQDSHKVRNSTVFPVPVTNRAVPYRLQAWTPAKRSSSTSET